jgi:UDP-GlcNAc3NAcA epimerase
LQKEAFFFHKPCVTLRNETEWVELVECGVNDVVGPDRAGIIEAERMLHRKKPDYSAALYGAGDAGDRIVEVLSQWPAGRTTTGAALSRTNPVLKAKK